jgi:cytidylate kinase
MKEHTREEPRIVAAAERQMHAWALAQEIADKAVRVDPSHRLTAEVMPYVTISREAGACGSEIAEMVGEQLGWQVLDKALLDHIAERFKLSRAMLELVDEKPGSWADDLVDATLDSQVIPHEKYLHHLMCVALAAAKRESVVFVGRGVQFLLPRPAGMAVRIIASDKFRLDRLTQRLGLADADARRYLAQVDQGRREFVLRYFHHDIDDPHLYDLVINAEGLGPVGAAEQIVAAVGR